MSDDGNDQTSPYAGQLEAPVKSEDRRAAELEELRKKQLAKSMSWGNEDSSGGKICMYRLSLFLLLFQFCLWLIL